MKQFFKVLPFLCLLFACGPQQQADQTANDAPAPAPSEEELVTRLSSSLEANAETQAKIDLNDIINYAMDNMLDIVGTPSGLYYQILEEGKGDLLKLKDRVWVHYRGTFKDATEFDSSYKRNEPLGFSIGEMIPGWNEGLQLMRPGGKIRLLLPSKLGYGEKGLIVGEKTIVPPNTVLIFDIEVLE